MCIDKTDHYNANDIYESMTIDEKKQYYTFLSSQTPSLERICINLFFVDGYSLNGIEAKLKINQSQVENTLYSGIENARALSSEFFRQEMSAKEALHLINDICVEMRFSRNWRGIHYLNNLELFFSNH